MSIEIAGFMVDLMIFRIEIRLNCQPSHQATVYKHILLFEMHRAEVGCIYAHNLHFLHSHVCAITKTDLARQNVKFILTTIVNGRLLQSAGW